MPYVCWPSRLGQEHDDRRHDREEWVEEVRIVATPPRVFEAPSGELRGPPEESLIVLCRRRRSKAAGRPQFANLPTPACDHEDVRDPGLHLLLQVHYVVHQRDDSI